MEFLFLGFFTGLSLILALGAQNVFVIEQGLKKQYVFARSFGPVSVFPLDGNRENLDIGTQGWNLMHFYIATMESPCIVTYFPKDKILISASNDGISCIFT